MPALKPGSTVPIRTQDTRWWVRLWCALTGKPLPTRVMHCKVDLI